MAMKRAALVVPWLYRQRVHLKKKKDGDGGDQLLLLGRAVAGCLYRGGLPLPYPTSTSSGRTGW